jgi:hypothetical protein
MSESDPDSLRALPVSLPQVVPLTPNPRPFLNSVTSCSSVKAGPSPTIRNVVGGYQTEPNQQGYYEWAPQVAGGQKRKYSEDARVPADALSSSLESTGSSGSFSSSVESSRSLDSDLDLRPPPSSSLGSSAECDYPTEEEVPLPDSNLRLVRLVLPYALLSHPTPASNVRAPVPHVLAVVPDQSRVDLYRFSRRLASDLEVNWEIAVDPQGSAALVGGAEAAVVYLRVADAQSAIPDCAKEALVSLLDLAEQHFRAGAVIIALEKTRANSKIQLKTLAYLGFRTLRPGAQQPALHASSRFLYMGYTIELS